MPSRRRSLALFGGVGAAAVSGGALAWESRAGGPGVPFTPDEAAPPERQLPPPAQTLAGDSVDWRPTGPGIASANDTRQQIKGYASATSVGLGESLDFHVSVNPAQKFVVRVFRLGRATGGSASQLVATSPEILGVPQAAPAVAVRTRTLHAEWCASWRLDVPRHWESGLYVATFENEEKFRNSVPFVVRDDAAKADLLVVLPFTTYQAYNLYPYDGKRGSSLYHAWRPDGSYGASDVCSTRVSFDRPYAGSGLPMYFDLDCAFVDWIEAQRYSVSYASGIDLHAGRVDTSKYRALVFSGHDEYWSSAMRDRLEQAIDSGVSAAFLTANNVYWNVRLDPSASGVEHRQVTCFKNRQSEDYDRPEQQQPTLTWRDIEQPEQRVLGAMYVSMVMDAKPQPLVVTGADHWFWRGTGVREGERIPKLVAGEADQVKPGVDGSPDVTYLAASPFTGNGRTTTEKMPQHTVLYQAPSGAWVFNAGTFFWNHGLSTPGFADLRIQTATRNLLDRMTGKVSA